MSIKKRALAALISLALFSAAGCGEKTESAPNEQELRPSEPEVIQPTEPEPEPEPEPIVKVSQAVIGATGDVLMHYPIIKTGAVGDGTYEFSSVFPYFSQYVTNLDYAAANLETTLAGLSPFQLS